MTGRDGVKAAVYYTLAGLRDIAEGLTVCAGGDADAGRALMRSGVRRLVYAPGFVVLAARAAALRVRWDRRP